MTSGLLLMISTINSKIIQGCAPRNHQSLESTKCGESNAILKYKIQTVFLSFFFFCCIFLSFIDLKLLTIFFINTYNSYTNRTFHHIFAYTHFLSSSLSSTFRYNKSTAQQQHKILYQSSCFCAYHISYCELLIYYLILRSLSQAGQSFEFSGELNTLIEGKDLLYLREYEYCLAIIKV